MTETAPAPAPEPEHEGIRGDEIVKEFHEQYGFVDQEGNPLGYLNGHTLRGDSWSRTGHLKYVTDSSGRISGSIETINKDDGTGSDISFSSDSGGKKYRDRVQTEEVKGGTPHNGGTFIMYEGSVSTPDQVPTRVTKSRVNSNTGENSRYQHEFKDVKKAGRLIAKLAEKRIQRDLHSSEKNEHKKAS